MSHAFFYPMFGQHQTTWKNCTAWLRQEQNLLHSVSTALSCCWAICSLKKD